MNSNFWHNHYEKVILATLLILFCGMLLVQTKMIQENRRTQVKEIMEKPEPPVDIEPQDYDALPKYQKDTVYGGNIGNWLAWKKENADNAQDISDMMTTTPLSMCPYCVNLIDANSFPAKVEVKAGQNAVAVAKANAKKCPYCSAELMPRTSSQAAFVAEGEEKVVEIDSDKNKNGIDDQIELKYGLSIEVDQSTEDMDKDGFTTIEEINAGTHPNDAKSHPALISKLFLDGNPINVTFEDILNTQVTIPDRKVKTIRILGNDTSVPKDGRTPSLAIQVIYQNSKLRNQIFYVKAGNPIPYHKASINEKDKDANAGLSNFRFTKVIPGKDMKSHVFVLESGDLKLEAMADRQIGTPFHNVKFRHVLHPNGITTYSAKEFEIGNAATGVERYIVTKIVSGKDPSVILTSVADKKQYTIKQEVVKAPVAEAAEESAQNEEK